jgi:hypothetical protein
MAVTAFLNQHYDTADLHEFWKMFCDGITCGKGDPVIKGDGSLGQCFIFGGLLNAL